MRILRGLPVLVLALGGCQRDLEPSWALRRWPHPTRPAISDHHTALFVTTGADGPEAVCVALENGGLGWHTRLDASPGAFAVTISGGQTLLATGTSVTSLDDLGAVIDLREFGSPVVEAPAVAQDGSLVVATEAGLVIGDRTIELPDIPVHQPILRMDGTVIVEGETGVSAVGDAVLWTYPLGGVPGPAPVADWDGNVYVVREGTLTALTPDGTLRWTHPSETSPAVGAEVVVATADGLVGIGSDGGDRWTVGGECGAAAIGRDGHAFAGCSLNGKNGVVQIEDGRVVDRAEGYSFGGFDSPPALGEGTMIIAWGSDPGGVAGLTGSPGPERGGGRAGIDERNSGRVH